MKKKKIAIFVIAYNEESTLKWVIDRIPQEVKDKVEEIFVFDDYSKDKTYEVGLEYKKKTGIKNLNIYKNEKNLGYGGNQKKGYEYAIKKGYDIVVMLHGDGQYAPEVLSKLLKPLEEDEADAVFGSRMMGHPIKGGMPLYKYFGNRFLTTIENWLLWTKLTEFHSGYRLYSCHALKQIPFKLCSDVFHFDTDIIVQFVAKGLRIVERPIPTYYGKEISYVNSIQYGLNVLKSVLSYRLHKASFVYLPKFDVGTPYNYKADPYSSHSKILKLVPKNKKLRILDIGCGQGIFAKALKKHNVIGIESDPKAAEKAKEYCDKIITANLNKELPGFHEKFDLLIFGDVIEHLINGEKVLRHFLQFLKEGGLVILSTGNIANFWIRLNLLFGRFNYTERGILDKTHTHLYTLKSFANLAKNCNLKIIKKDATPIPLPLIWKATSKGRFLFFMHFINNLITKLWKKMFGFQIILYCKK